MKLDDALTILLVEDDFAHAYLIELILREVGVDNPLIKINNGSEAEAFLFIERNGEKKAPRCFRWVTGVRGLRR